MKFGLKHILFVAFIIAFALGVRSAVIKYENDAVLEIGVLVASFITAFGLTMLNTNRWMAWLAGAATTFAMCIIDLIERANTNPEMVYHWRDAQYATDPEIRMIATIMLTSFSAIISGVGTGVGLLIYKLIQRNAEARRESDSAQ